MVKRLFLAMLLIASIFQFGCDYKCEVLDYYDYYTYLWDWTGVATSESDAEVKCEESQAPYSCDNCELE